MPQGSASRWDADSPLWSEELFRTYGYPALYPDDTRDTRRFEEAGGLGVGGELVSGSNGSEFGPGFRAA